MLDNTGDTANLRCRLHGIGNSATCTVEDVVIFIGDVVGTVRTLTELRVQAERFKLSRDDGEGHLNDFYG